MKTSSPIHRVVRAGSALLAALMFCISAACGEPTETVQVEAPDGRLIDVSIWRPDAVEGVVLFSHGAGGAPAGYDPILSAWADAGFLVLAPLHVDSRRHPDTENYTVQSAFPVRLADMGVMAGLAAQEAPDAGVIAAGHSYGAMMAAMSGGALPMMGGRAIPSVDGILMLSSPGLLNGMVTPQAYATIEVPLMVITGDADIVPGWVENWEDHLAAYEGAPEGEKYAIIHTGGDHRFGLTEEAASPVLASTIENSLVFLKAYGTGDEAALEALSDMTSSDLADVRKR